MKVLINGTEESAHEVYGKEYLDERFYSPVYTLHSGWSDIPTCYGEFDGGEFKLVKGLDGELLAVIL